MTESKRQPPTSSKSPQILTLLRICAAKPTEFDCPSAYELIMRKTRELHMANTTVVQDLTVHAQSSKFSMQRPMHVDDMSEIIEIIDDAKHIEAFLPVLGEMLRDGILALKSVQVLPGYLLNRATH